jgi:hypothetical protein
LTAGRNPKVNARNTTTGIARRAARRRTGSDGTGCRTLKVPILRTLLAALWPVAVQGERRVLVGEQ